MTGLTYSAYLELHELLALQRPRSAVEQGEAEHDELLFIIIHQVYELWFKQLLHEIDYANARFVAGSLTPALQTLKRTRAILKVIVGQVDVLETMTPLEFASFRSRLDTSSGLQSAQFRELEFALGMKSASAIGRYSHEPGAQERLTARLHAPSLWDAFLGCLVTLGHGLPSGVQTPTDSSTAQNPELQQALLELYKSDAGIAAVCEALLDIDEGLQEWRYRHIKMVERTIGHKLGTGGTNGVAYLQNTLFSSAFPDLWALRARF